MERIIYDMYNEVLNNESKWTKMSFKREQFSEICQIISEIEALNVNKQITVEIKCSFERCFVHFMKL